MDLNHRHAAYETVTLPTELPRESGPGGSRTRVQENREPYIDMLN
jgi:hypothetical protein